jgi:histidine ammonia-lyase
MGVGDPLPEARVRAMMAVRVSQLAMGRSGIAPATLEALVHMLDRGVTPRVPSIGSVGASDLAPLAHAALLLIGEGRAVFEGRETSGAEAMAAAGIAAPLLQGRDALAWINAPADAVGMAALAMVDCGTLLASAETTAALSLSALGSHKGAFDERLIAQKPHPGAVECARRLWTLLPNAGVTRREPLSIRCIPHVVGSAWDALRALEAVVRLELDAPTDNPIWLGVPEGFFGGGSTFDSHRLSQVLDGLAEALGAVAFGALRRTERLLDPTTNGGLPPFLIAARGEEAERSSGLMIAQYTAVALLARMRATTSASALAMTTCNGFEDALSFSSMAAERAADAIRIAARIVAIEAIVAAQALDLAGSGGTEAIETHRQIVRDVCPFLSRDRSLGDAIERLASSLLVSRASDSRSVPQTAPSP